MHPKRRSADDRGISPVIGVALLVAITMVLAVVVSVSLFGIGAEQPQDPVQTSFAFEYDDSDGNLRITLQNGEAMRSDRLYVRGSVGGDDNVGRWHNLPAATPTSPKSDLAPGSSVTLGLGPGDNVPETYELRIVYQSEDSQTSTTLAQDTGPRA